MPIHTHEVFKHLKKDDVFTEEQADRLADALAGMDVASATKEDLNEVEERLSQRIELSEERLGQRISDLRSDLYRVILVSFGAVAALVTILNFVA
jgi:anti-sigma-K factor RskA